MVVHTTTATVTETHSCHYDDGCRPGSCHCNRCRSLSLLVYHCQDAGARTPSSAKRQDGTVGWRLRLEAVRVRECDDDVLIMRRVLRCCIRLG